MNEVAQEYRLQQWAIRVQERQSSGMTVKDWCAEQGISEHVYYYRLRRLREKACEALEATQQLQLAEVPLAPSRSEAPGLQVRVNLAGGSVEIKNANSEALSQILQVLKHVD